MSGNEEGNRWVHPVFQKLQCGRNGPFVELADGSLLTVDERGLGVSSDDGATWSDGSPICEGVTTEPSIHYLVRTRDGALVMIYVDMAARKFAWDDSAGEPKDCGGALRSIRSLDGGKTWGDGREILAGCFANYFGFIQTKGGRLVAAVPILVEKPGRWVVRSVFSDDDGMTWGNGNLIDLGGHGHHDGALEPSIAELDDGRVLMFIRTNLDRFWQAFSEDGGRYWRTLLPTNIDASSAPGMLLKLRSGRLALVWSRLNPEDGSSWPKAAEGHGQATEFPASWFREELSLAFSGDDGVTWTPPLVFARQKGGQLSYPYLFERRPGELWITAGFTFTAGWGSPQSPLRLKVDEKAVLAAVAPRC